MPKARSIIRPPLRFLVDTGADGMAVSVATSELADMKIDDQSENTGADGTTLVDYSTNNTVALGGASRTLGAAVIDVYLRPNGRVALQQLRR